MLESLLSMEGLEGLKSFFSEALQTEFTRTLAIFSGAAWVHGRQVSKEIRKQVGELIAVLQQDLEANKFFIAALTNRVNNIEVKLGIEAKPQTTLKEK